MLDSNRAYLDVLLLAAPACSSCGTAERDGAIPAYAGRLSWNDVRSFHDALGRGNPSVSKVNKTLGQRVTILGSYSNQAGRSVVLASYDEFDRYPPDLPVAVKLRMPNDSQVEKGMLACLGVISKISDVPPKYDVNEDGDISTNLATTAIAIDVLTIEYLGPSGLAMPLRAEMERRFLDFEARVAAK